MRGLASTGANVEQVCFRSKKDRWLGVVLWAGVLMLAGAAIAVWLAEPGPAGALVAVLSAAVAALVLWVWYGTDYRLGASELRVRSGPFRFRVPLASVEEAHPSSNPLSSPALSLDRLFLRTGRGPLGGILISPEPRDRFLAELAARTGLTREGDRLLRR